MDYVKPVGWRFTLEALVVIALVAWVIGEPHTLASIERDRDAATGDGSDAD
jgi:hypothetical protein